MINRIVRHWLPIASIALLTLAVPAAGTGQVFVVQGGANEVYRQAAAGFEQALPPAVSLPGQASIPLVECVVLDPASPDNSRETTLKYQVLQPKLTVAVGTSALRAVSSLPGPVLYLMVPDPDAVVGGRPETTGVRMEVAPARQLEAIATTFPSAVRIGLLRHAVGAAGFLAAAKEGAAAGLSLVDIPAASDREAMRAITNGATAIDAVLLTPDPELISPVLLDGLALLSLERKIPVIAFAPKYLQYGAAMVVFASPEAMGRQAGRMAREILNGSRPAAAPPEYAEEATVRTNSAIVQKMGIRATTPARNTGTASP